MNKKNILCIIPARGGSKGIPRKNIELLNGKSLIYYTIEVARAVFDDSDICVSTDDDEIINIVEKCSLKVPFKRPPELATDTATSNDVLIHALEFYESKGVFYDVIVLLQPTSPLRTVENVKEALSLYNENIDMVVSVKKSHTVSSLCQETEAGFLELCFNSSGLRRQDFSSFYEYNGAVYVINVNSLKKYSLSGLKKVKKYLMDELSSVDIDNNADWEFAEHLIKTSFTLK